MTDIPSRVTAVTLRVSNVEASAEFYSWLIGLETAQLGLERAELRPPGSDRTLLTLLRASQPGRAPGAAAGLFHTAFRFPDRAGLADALQRAAERNIPLSGVADHGVSEALYLDDPDGLGIELYRDRPIAQWPATVGDERVHMFTEPLDVAALAADATSRELPQAAAGLDIGHVHLKVGDVTTASDFWTETVGMEPMTAFGADAAFLGMDGYHHHIGLNQWMSRGAPLEPAEGPGLESVCVRAGENVPGAGGSLRTPDGVQVMLDAS